MRPGLALSERPARAGQDIRIRQLLGHTSGLPDIVDQKGDLIGGGTEADAWKAVQKLPADAVAGATFSCNQTNHVLLSRIIAKQAKTPYDTYIATPQFAVAKMPLSTFGDRHDLVLPMQQPSMPPRRAGRRQPSVQVGLCDTLRSAGRWWHPDNGGSTCPLAHHLVDRPPDQPRGSPEDVGAGKIEQRRRRRVGSRMACAANISPPASSRNRWRAGGLFVDPDDGLAIIVLTHLAGANPQRLIPHMAALYKPDGWCRWADEQGTSGLSS